MFSPQVAHFSIKKWLTFHFDVFSINGSPGYFFASKVVHFSLDKNTLVLLLLVALLAWRALRQVGSNAADEESGAHDGERVDDEAMKEKISEY